MSFLPSSHVKKKGQEYPDFWSCIHFFPKSPHVFFISWNLQMYPLQWSHRQICPCLPCFPFPIFSPGQCQQTNQELQKNHEMQSLHKSGVLRMFFGTLAHKNEIPWFIPWQEMTFGGKKQAFFFCTVRTKWNVVVKGWNIMALDQQAATLCHKIKWIMKKSKKYFRQPEGNRIFCFFSEN